MKYVTKSLGLLLCLIVTLAISCKDQHPEKLKGGVALMNITPPVGARLAGHFYEAFSTGVHDSIWAKAIVLEQGNQKFAFVFCDLIGITRDISTQARKLASTATEIPLQNILVAATHSHTGPLFYGFQHTYFHNKAIADDGVDEHEKADYPDFLIHQIEKAVVKANESVMPISIEAGVGREDGLSFNRRYYMKNGTVLFNPGPLNPDIVGPAGPIDPEVGILLLRNAGSKDYMGGLTVFAMHADCIGGTKMSADYPYYLEQTLKKKFGQQFFSAFSLGPAGDINDVDIKKDQPIYSDSNTQKIGSTLGQVVIQAVPELKRITQPSFASFSSKILVPLQVPSRAQIDSADVLINNLYKVSQTGAYIRNAGGESGDFLKRVEMSKYLALKDQKPAVDAEVQVFRIDSRTAIVGLPGEIFSELGLDLKKRSPFENTIVMTVCNDRISYIPTIKAFKEGSYEVTNSIIKPGGGEMLVETAVKLLKEAKDGLK
ncbi:neutral/alkaline non-lysosomal ceramidase N-terminal domain-containing protein [Niabella soli]|nr:neutral/alkaline non-lysosomal ceramidase N-terminal domain-containing protein [Niabella soli]